MKTTIKISMIALLASSLVQADENQMKKYDVKSAKIEYEIKGSGGIMGVEIKTIGKKRLIFDEYGAKELEEESKVTKTTGMGQNKVDKTHTLKYMNNSIIYSVNFEKEKIVRMQNPAVAMSSIFGGGKNIQQIGEEMLEKMGGKKIGTDKVAGHQCDIWDVSGIKQCIYKGIPLRVESNIMGIKSTEVATKAEFDLSLDKDAFKLPDFPMYDEYGKKIDIDKLDTMDKKETPPSVNNGVDMAKAMRVGMAAAQKAGYDMRSGKEMTPAQEEAMQKAMMDAMGGEKVFFERQKKEILAESEDMPSAMKSCVEKSQTMDDLKKCFPDDE
ncbi:hypothetical protein GSY74_08870 [Sulfurovum sp. bin170]|uniref:hypothetical protein n=1 Tax=Sulfurovum sp. bin170 TaxID=2695268 RepID=UPI0013DFD6D4|nr:hypothetical protein [Sulfurovum sp. bin170]NEW61393.1 hypothetical protein [Sulfurovum sp. bin170]